MFAILLGVLKNKGLALTTHMFIPDIQAKPDVDFTYLKAIGNYMVAKKPDVVVCIGDFADMESLSSYARSSSLVGSNAYAEDALNLTGRASQNIYIMHEGGGFDGVKVDLQNADSYDGYAITKQLETYNTKSASKAHEQEVIFKVVI